MLYYARDGEVIAAEEFARRFNDPGYRRVRLDRLGGRRAGWVMVSTIWLGIDHDWTGEGPPLIFETMARVEGVESWGEARMWRHTTETEALACHEAVCAEARVLFGLDAHYAG